MPSGKKQKTILYFGLFDPEYSRNKVYIEGLRRNGVEVLICNDESKGLAKFWRLWKKHWKVRKDYDFLIVGYGGQITVPLARLISRKPVIFDALCSFYEVNVISRDAFRGNPFRLPYVRFVDWISTRSAHFILVETDRQKDYFISELGVRANKLVTVYIGVDDAVFHPDDSIRKAGRFTVLFRGRITAESGATHVIAAAKMLEDEPAGKEIDFLVIGYGWDEAMRKFDAVLSELTPKNLRHIREYLPFEKLRPIMLSSHASLGQLEDHERLSRTIPHKAYESLAMRLTYVTARAAGIEEIATDGVNCLMVNPADPADLAAKIKMLRDDPVLALKLADAGFALYRERFTPEKVVRPILDLFHPPS